MRGKRMQEREHRNRSLPGTDRGAPETTEPIVCKQANAKTAATVSWYGKWRERRGRVSESRLGEDAATGADLVRLYRGPVDSGLQIIINFAGYFL